MPMGEVSGVGGGEAPRGGGKGEDVEDEAVGMKGEWRATKEERRWRKGARKGERNLGINGRN